jgi:hypothetical protein
MDSATSYVFPARCSRGDIYGSLRTGVASQVLRATEKTAIDVFLDDLVETVKIT